MADCLFCRVVAGEIPATVVMEDEDTIAIEDINPQAPVHVLVIPREHSESPRALDDDRLMGALFRTAHRVAQEKGAADSGYRLLFNVGPDANQTVMHTHLHVLGGRRMGWPPG